MLEFIGSSLLPLDSVQLPCLDLFFLSSWALASLFKFPSIRVTMATISAQAASSLKERIDKATSEQNGLPGVTYCAVNKDGDLIFEHASGKRGLGQEKDMDLDTIFCIASCTKMITGIAAMQLVEQGKLDLDSVELVEKLAPVCVSRRFSEPLIDGVVRS